MTDWMIKQALGSDWKITRCSPLIWLVTSDQLDHMNDFIELWLVCDNNEHLTITDDGEMFSEMLLLGLDIRRQYICDKVSAIISGYNIHMGTAKELVKHTDISSLSTDMSDFVLCIKKIIKDIIIAN